MPQAFEVRGAKRLAFGPVEVYVVEQDGLPSRVLLRVEDKVWEVNGLTVLESGWDAFDPVVAKPVDLGELP